MNDTLRKDILSRFCSALTDAQRDEVNRYMAFYELIWKLREIGEYQAAVYYLSQAESIMGVDAEEFTKFCDAAFHGYDSEEQRLADDAVNVLRELADERHFVFSEMRSIRGRELIDEINNSFACPRALRYERLRKVISLYDRANIADIGSAEARLEEHCNRINTDGDHLFHVADRSAYILLQAQYRNRLYNNIAYYALDFSSDYDHSLFEFPREAPVIVVVSEFLEHMERERGVGLLMEILRDIRPRELLITTPNYDFSEICKKDDPNNMVHVFEYRESEFAEEMKRVTELAGGRYRLEELSGVAGNADMPQSLFARITLKANGENA